MPNLIIIFGPPASGKAAVGHELAALTGYKFFHNHLTADPAAALFGWGTDQFGEMTNAIRDLLFREVVSDNSILGVVFTIVWGLDLPDDTNWLKNLSSMFIKSGGQVFFVELQASLPTRIAREGTPFRVTLKPYLRDVDAARLRQVTMDENYKMNTDGTLPFKYPHLLINTEETVPKDAALIIENNFSLLSNN